MRIDKFLKIAMIFKTRSSAEKAIENGELLLNGKKIKPSSTVKIGDILTLKTLLKETTYQVLNISEKNVSKKDAKELTKIIEEKKIEF